MSCTGTKADFVEWLRSKKPRAVVGVRQGEGWGHREGTPCPLGAWARERGLHHGFFYGSESFWMSVDASGPPLSGITARKCLQLLGAEA